MLQSTALKVLQTGVNVFLTGEAGSGKTHTVNQYVAWLRDHGIEPAITASTGIAATHVGGMTLHSWSGIGVRTHLSDYDLDALASNKRLRDRVIDARVLIIDEISMLSSDTLEMADQALRAVRGNSYPFGGLQVVMVGDFFQLPPVMRRGPDENARIDLDEYEEPRAPFAFTSPSWDALNPVVCYLHEQHRQADPRFVQLLGSLRKNLIDDDARETLASRMIQPDEQVLAEMPQLFSHNAAVDRVNESRLETLRGKPHRFVMLARGPERMVEGLKRNCLSPEVLVLREGAKVMFTKNDPMGRYVNGTLGEVESFAVSGYPVVRTRAGVRIEAEPSEWKLDDSGKTLARIEQIPLRLAWAITIHKSQGMTLDAAVMDLSHAFEYGQGYVALSRVRSLEGLHLLGVNERSLEVHPQVRAQDVVFKRNSAAARARFESMREADHAQLTEAFVRAVGGVPEGSAARVVKKKKVREKGASQKETLALVRQHKTLAEIAAARELTEGTVATHIADLFVHGDIDTRTLESLVSVHVRDALPDIRKTFEKYGAEKLLPAHKALGGAFTYAELTLARLLCG